jgi:hypothetical protein
MFSIRGLLAVTLFFACLIALGGLGTIDGMDRNGVFKVSLAVAMHLIAFLSILTWIHELEQLRRENRRYLVAFADTTAFLMFAGQLFMACRVFGVLL